MRERVELVGRYARVHRLARAVLVLIGLLAISQRWGTVQFSLPGNHGSTTFSLAEKLPFLFAVLAVGTLGSVMEWAEGLSPGAGRRRALHAVVAIGGTGLAILVNETLATSPTSGMLLTRAFLIWSGLALVSGRLLGWSLAWALPSPAVFAMVYYGENVQAEPLWWNWVSVPLDQPGAWGIALLSGVLGAGALALTPWRVARLRRRLGRRST